MANRKNNLRLNNYDYESSRRNRSGINSKQSSKPARNGAKEMLDNYFPPIDGSKNDSGETANGGDNSFPFTLNKVDANAKENVWFNGSNPIKYSKPMPKVIEHFHHPDEESFDRPETPPFSEDLLEDKKNKVDISLNDLQAEAGEFDSVVEESPVAAEGDISNAVEEENVKDVQLNSTQGLPDAEYANALNKEQVKTRMGEIANECARQFLTILNQSARDAALLFAENAKIHLPAPNLLLEGTDDATKSLSIEECLKETRLEFYPLKILSVKHDSIIPDKCADGENSAFLLIQICGHIYRLEADLSKEDSNELPCNYFTIVLQTVVKDFSLHQSKTFRFHFLDMRYFVEHLIYHHPINESPENDDTKKNESSEGEARSSAQGNGNEPNGESSGCEEKSNVFRLGDEVVKQFFVLIMKGPECAEMLFHPEGDVEYPVDHDVVDRNNMPDLPLREKLEKLEFHESEVIITAINSYEWGPSFENSDTKVQNIAIETLGYREEEYGEAMFSLHFMVQVHNLDMPTRTFSFTRISLVHHAFDPALIKDASSAADEEQQDDVDNAVNDEASTSPIERVYANNIDRIMSLGTNENISPASAGTEGLYNGSVVPKEGENWNANMNAYEKTGANSEVSPPLPNESQSFNPAQWQAEYEKNHQNLSQLHNNHYGNSYFSPEQFSRQVAPHPDTQLNNASYMQSSTIAQTTTTNSYRATDYSFVPKEPHSSNPYKPNNLNGLHNSNVSQLPKTDNRTAYQNYCAQTSPKTETVNETPPYQYNYNRQPQINDTPYNQNKHFHPNRALQSVRSAQLSNHPTTLQRNMYNNNLQQQHTNWLNNSPHQRMHIRPTLNDNQRFMNHHHINHAASMHQVRQYTYAQASPGFGINAFQNTEYSFSYRARAPNVTSDQFFRQVNSYNNRYVYRNPAFQRRGF